MVLKTFGVLFKTTCLGIFDEVIIIKANEPALNDRTSL